MKDKTWRTVGSISVSLFMLLVLFVQYGPSWADPDPSEDTQGFIVSYSQKNRARFGECDATSKYMFFSYGGGDTEIDVYDTSANFLYRLIFADSDNGVSSIRCDNDLLYLKLKNDSVFVLDGSTLIQKMSGLEAKNVGYTNEWFEGAKRSITVDSKYIYFLDTEGNHISQISKPENIKPLINYIDFGPVGNRIAVGLSAVFVIGFILYHIFKSEKKGR